MQIDRYLHVLSITSICGPAFIDTSPSVHFPTYYCQNSENERAQCSDLKRLVGRVERVNKDQFVTSFESDLL